MSLSGKVAIITGSSRGIGAGIAIEFARRGANIAIVYTSLSSTNKAEAVARTIRELGRQAVIIRSDLASDTCGDEVLQATMAGFEIDRIDILVNNAADTFNDIHSLAFESSKFQYLMNVNARAPSLLVKAIVPHINTGGRIINITSAATRMPSPGMGIYCATKVALEAFSRQWALELAERYNITVNAISVGYVDTDLAKSQGPDAAGTAEIFQRTTAAHRAGTPSDIAHIAAFLASEEARWVNGDIVSGNGGLILC